MTTTETPRDLVVGGDPTPAEAAAIAAAVEAYLVESTAPADDDAWASTGVRQGWALAERFERVGLRPPTVAPGGPTDPWTLAGRSDRH